MTHARHRTRQVNSLEVFVREVGPVDAPVLSLLHGFPYANHMLRDLIPALADHDRVIAPDLPGFGLTPAPGTSLSPPIAGTSPVMSDAPSGSGRVGVGFSQPTSGQSP